MSSIIQWIKSELITRDFSCCCRVVILLALIIMVFVRCWKCLCMQFEAFTTYCKKWVVPFVRRFVFMLIVGAILLRCIAFAICKVDLLDVVQRATTYLAPYHSSFPFMLILLALALVCCIPGGTTMLLDVFKRVKRVGPVEFYKAKNADPDVAAVLSKLQSMPIEKVRLADVQKARLQVKFRKELNRVPKDRRMQVMKTLNDLISQNRNIIAFHAGQIGAVLVERGVKIQESTMSFDAHLKRDDDQIAVCIINWLSKSPLGTAQQAKAIFDRLPFSKTNAFFIHLVFCIDSHGKSCVKDIELIRRLLFNVSNVRLFFYDIGDNNAVAPSEIIP